jgi:hypothetical protein
MAKDRREHLKEVLDLYQEQIQGLEQDLPSASSREKVPLQQNIRRIKEEMRPYEEEYWGLIAEEAKASALGEAEAIGVVAEVIQGAQTLTAQPAGKYPPELMKLVQELLDRLNQLDQDAAGKVGFVFSWLPPFVSVSYEKDVPFRPLLQRHFPTVMRLLGQPETPGTEPKK